MTTQTQTTTDELTIPQLIENLGKDDFLKRQHARLLLVQRKPESISSLKRALKNPNVHTRWEAARALGDIQDPETAPELAQLLMDNDVGVRWVAMESLIRMDRDCLRPVLERFAKDFGSIWMRRGVHHILHVLRDRHELTPLEVDLFNKLDEKNFLGMETGVTSEQVLAAKKALAALEH